MIGKDRAQTHFQSPPSQFEFFQIPNSYGVIPMAFQTLARPCFCPDQTPGHLNFTAASLSELASGSWLAMSNSSMAAMSRARLYGDEPVRPQFPSQVEKAGKAT
ncbi:MAG: hypothetical protein WBD78_10845 [Methylocella sp.]